MRVLVLGAYGFIGSAVAGELVAHGHEVTGLGRDIAYGMAVLPELHWIAADLSRMTSADCWKAPLATIDVVVNASGLLQSGDGGSVQAVQFEAIRALVAACEAAGIKRFVQISAAGARTDANSDFMSTKARADALVLASAIPSLIVRPGLVIGRNAYGGTELIRAAAAIPMNLDRPFKTTIQCIALPDVVDAVVRALEADHLPEGIFDLVERQPRSLESIIAMHRQWLGLREPRWRIGIPFWSLRLISRIADVLGHLGWRSPLRRNGLRALEMGVQGTAQENLALLGREPVPLEHALARYPAGKQDRLHARLTLALPVMLGSLFVMWTGSGIATLLRLDHAVAIVQASGMDRGTALAIAIGGAWLDIALAAGLVLRRTVRASLLAMILLTVFIYLIGGTMLLPGLWLDPLAPLAKALPATLLALVAYWLVEKR